MDTTITPTPFMNSAVLGAISAYPIDNSSGVELSASIAWSKESTEICIFCDHMTDPPNNMKTAVLMVESRWSELSQLLPLSKLQLWCLSGLRELMPWFLTERLLQPDEEGNVFITSTPEEMVNLLIPTLMFRHDFNTSRTDVYGHLSCPLLDESNKVNCDVNSWLGNHDYRFTIDDRNKLTNFHTDG